MITKFCFVGGARDDPDPTEVAREMHPADLDLNDEIDLGDLTNPVVIIDGEHVPASFDGDVVQRLGVASRGEIAIVLFEGSIRGVSARPVIAIPSSAAANIVRKDY